MTQNKDKTLFEGTNRFEVLSELGIGGGGAVYEVFDKNDHRRVALKTLTSDDEQRIASFKEEFSTLKTVEHENLISIYELFNEEGRWFFTMELIEGSDFVTYVRGGGREFDEGRLRSCLKQLVSAVAELHRQGIIHRDIKPTNTVVTKEGHLVLLDFGLATEVIAGRQVGGIAAVGTKNYMAPEQSFGLPVGAPADWYSLGVILYQALTGRLPHDKDLAREEPWKNWWEAVPPVVLDPAVPADLNELCLGMVRNVPEERLRGPEIMALLGLSAKPMNLSGALGAEWAMTSFDYVGRAREIEELKQAANRVATGQTASIVITGEAGIGKTALAKEFVRQLRDDSRFLVLRGRFSLGASVRFRAFRSVIDQVKEELRKRSDPKISGGDGGGQPDEIDLLSPEAATAVTQLFPALMGVDWIISRVNHSLKIVNPQELRAEAYGAVRTLLSNLASHCHVVLFLDDIQWADPDSLSLLTDIMNPSQSPPLLLIVTMRSEHEEDLDLTRVLPGAMELQLEGLDPSEAKDLTQSICRYYGVESGAFDEDDNIVGEAQGHPLFLAELVKCRAQLGAEADIERLEDAIWSRIERLKGEARKMLEIVCVSVVPLDEEILAEIAGLDRTEWVPALGALLVGGFVQTSEARGEEKIEPYHDRIRETMLTYLDPASLRRHHLTLAYELAHSDELFDKEIVVRHLEGAGKNQEAADLAKKTASLALKQLAFGKASELLTTALRLGDYSESQHLKLQMELGDALCQAGQGAEAYAVYLLAGGDADPTTRLDCYRRAIDQLMLTGHFEEGYRQVDNLLAEIGVSLPKTRKKALFSLLRHRLRLKIRGMGWKKREEYQIPPGKLAELDIYAAVAGGLALIDNIFGADFQVRSLLVALNLGEEKRLAHALTMEAIFLGSQGKRSRRRAEKLIQESVEIAERTKDPVLYYGNCAATGCLCYFRGLYLQALEHLVEAEKGLRSESAARIHALNSTRVLLVSSLRLLGRLPRHREVFDNFVWDARQRGDRFLESSIRLLSGRIFLADDSIAEAKKNLAQSPWVPPAGGYHLNHWYELVTRTELALYMKRPEVFFDQFQVMFADLENSMTLRIVTIRAEAYWLKGRMLIADPGRNEWKENDFKSLKSLIRKIKRDEEQIRSVKAWSALLGAAVAHRTGQGEEAISLLRNGIQSALESEQFLIAESARLRLGIRLGGAEGEELVRQSTEWMQSQGVRKPERMAEVFVPGFGQR